MSWKKRYRYGDIYSNNRNVKNKNYVNYTKNMNLFVENVYLTLRVSIRNSKYKI